MPAELIPLPAAATHAGRILDRQLELWPEHQPFLARSFAERTPKMMALTEEIATHISRLVGDRLDDYCFGYRWMCEAVLEEELFFRRHGRYQATSFADVYRAVYDDPRTMHLYMDGLLLSQIFWRNHVDVAAFYHHYLSTLSGGYRHLEIGPGHGLLLADAARDPRCARATAWDISDASLASTAQCLDRIGVTTPVSLEKRNIYELGPGAGSFDSIVVSEVLEHLEDPVGALRGVRSVLAPQGRAFINIPCNSPAPDHLYLFAAPDEFFAMLEAEGLRIVERVVTPSTGWTLERALKHKLAVSCAAIVTASGRG